VVKSATISAFSSVSVSEAYPQAALSILTKPLKGVGPATATLVISLANPDGIPFFSDELYAWLLQHDSDMGKLKLKYDLKEYQQLFDKWVEFRETPKREGFKAVDVEKAAYVIGHWDALPAEDKKKVSAGKIDGVKEESGGNQVHAVKEAIKVDVEEQNDEPAEGDDLEAVGDIMAAGGQPTEGTSTLEMAMKRKRVASPCQRANGVKKKKPVTSEESGTRRSNRLKNS
jgi:hypothetical protein